MSRYHRVGALVLLVLVTQACDVWRTAPAPTGTVVKVTVPSAALEGNLLGDPAESQVAVYLPPSYDGAPERRYPTLFLLHGYLGSPDEFGTTEGEPGYQGMQLGEMMDDLIARGVAREMIVVVPNGRNAYFGSFYTNSSVTGGWEDVIAQEVVSTVDANYRTLAAAESRGIAGHSMGGYGAIMLAMRHPEVFSAFYALSPCCVGLDADLGPENPAWRNAIGIRSQDQLTSDPETFDEFFSTVFIAMSAAFSPDSASLLYVDLPFREERGQLVVDETPHASWRSKMPLYNVEQYKGNLESLRGIYLDYGALEEFSHIQNTTRAFSSELASHGIAHTFEVYADGTHGNMIRERLETRVLRFFSEVLHVP